MDPMRLFPDVDGMAATQRQWQIDPLPVPLFDLACPVCRRGSTRFGTVLLRSWSYHSRGHAASNHDRLRRCDVSFKCTECAHVWVHGLVVPEQHYQARAQQKRQWHWREGRDLIAGVLSERGELEGLSVPTG